MAAGQNSVHLTSQQELLPQHSCLKKKTHMSLSRLILFIYFIVYYPFCLWFPYKQEICLSHTPRAKRTHGSKRSRDVDSVRAPRRSFQPCGHLSFHRNKQMLQLHQATDLFQQRVPHLQGNCCVTKMFQMPWGLETSGQLNRSEYTEGSPCTGQGHCFGLRNCSWKSHTGSRLHMLTNSIQFHKNEGTYQRRNPSLKGSYSHFLGDKYIKVKELEGGGDIIDIQNNFYMTDKHYKPQLEKIEKKGHTELNSNPSFSAGLLMRPLNSSNEGVRERAQAIIPPVPLLLIQPQHMLSR